MMRATWSTEPPGGNTATSLMACLLGQAWACANRGRLKAAQATASPKVALKVRRCMAGRSRDGLMFIPELFVTHTAPSLRLIRMGKIRGCDSS